MSLYILGGSITGGAGVGNVSLAWPGLVGENNLVFYKNAIEPAYFLHCSERFRPPRLQSFRAAVLDFGPNLWSRGSAIHLARLANVSRRLANATSVFMIAWPRRGKRQQDTNRVEEAARLSGSDVVIPRLSGDWYADAVHPNKNGHEAIADAVRKAVSERGSSRMRIEHAPSGPTKELCYSDARMLPVSRVGKQWRLTDDSRQQDVHKFGWKVGSEEDELRLVLSPFCASVVSIGFLRSHDEGGHFRMMCAAPCSCGTIRGYWQKVINPFPDVFTRTSQKMRVTDTTTFSLIAGNASNCTLRIRGTRSRIDSLYIRAAEMDDLLNAALSTETQHKQFAKSYIECNA